MLKQLFRNKPTEEKVCNTNQAFIDEIMASIGSKKFSDNQCYNIYTGSDAVRDAISIITEKIRGMDIVIRNVTTDEVVRNREAEKFLRSPNEEQTQADFLEDLATWYLLTGNCYTEMLGENGLSWAYAVPTTTVNITTVTNSVNYNVNINNAYQFLQGNFKKQLDGRLLGFGKELYHTRGFTDISVDVKGSSPLEAIFDYIQLNEGALQYNVNNFSNGNFMAGLLNIVGGGADAVRGLKDKIEQKVSGVKGAGQILVTNAQSSSFNSFQHNNRDSMTTDLLKLSDEHIYRIYSIPAPLRNAEVQSYNNYQTAQGALYLDAVIPTVEKVLQGLTKLLRFRGVLSDDEKLDYDITSLEVLRALRMETTKMQKEIGVNTINEIRAELGYEELTGNDGNVLTTQNVATTAPAEEEQTVETDSASKQYFIDTLMDKKGYSKEKAIKLWNTRHNQ